jgi:hypothetical protein
MRAVLAILLLAQAASALPARTTAVPLSAADSARTTVGKLVYRAGLEIQVDDPRFGGISGFELTADGKTLVSVSDRGYWITLALKHDASGVLVDVPEVEIHSILGAAGQTLSKQWGDAEEVTILADGRLLVSFEHQHRLGTFPGLSQLPSAREHAWRTPTGMQSAPPNGGIEAMTALPDGRLLAIGEKPKDASGVFGGWLLGAKQGESTFGYATVDGFQPTGVAVSESGEILVLERRFSMLTGIAARIVRVPLAAFEGDKTVRSVELARFGSGVICDNFEALTARRDSSGGTAIYIGSDDNYNGPEQRTLLLQLLYPPTAVPASR